jgi:hypothetical protein
MSVNRALGAAYTPNYSIDEIQRAATAPSEKEPGKYRRVLGGVVGGATNLMFPGLGTAIGGLISGGKLNSSGTMGEAQQYLEMQRTIQQESRAFEAASTILKVRHDASMSAVRNMK